MDCPKNDIYNTQYYIGVCVYTSRERGGNHISYHGMPIGTEPGAYIEAVDVRHGT